MRSRLAQYLLLSAIVFGTFPSPLRAQTQITTGVIRGTVAYPPPFHAVPDLLP